MQTSDFTANSKWFVVWFKLEQTCKAIVSLYIEIFFETTALDVNKLNSKRKVKNVGQVISKRVTFATQQFGRKLFMFQMNSDADEMILCFKCTVIFFSGLYNLV